MSRLLARRDLTVATILLLFAVEALIRFRSHIDHDVAWYLYAGGRLLAGAVLYEDVVELNPPLGVWLSVPIAAIAQAIGVSAAAVVKTILFVATALSLLLSARFMEAAADISAGARNAFLILLAALMLFVPGADFGHRDHFVIVLATPWLLLRWNRLLDRDVPATLAVAVGLLAAVGFWLKPHFLLAVLAVEMTMLFATRNLRTTLRIENLAIVILGGAYLLAIWLTVFRYLAPLALLGARAFVPIYGTAFEEIVRLLILPCALGAIAVAGNALITPQLQLLRTLLIVAGAAFLGVFVLQVGYRYQLMPGLFFMALAASLGLARVVGGDIILSGFGQRVVAVAAAIAILAVFVLSAAIQFVLYRGLPFERAIAAEAPHARSIFIASTRTHHPFPLVENEGLVWASRFPAQWLAPHIATRLDDTGGPDEDIGRYALRATLDDLVRYQPEIVFIDERPSAPDLRGAPLDYVQFWVHDPRFKRFWEPYRRRGTVAGFGVYVLTE